MRYWYFYLSLVTFITHAVETPYVIFFFVKEYPEPEPPCKNPQPGLLQLDPGSICMNIMQKKFEKPIKAGVIAAYNGFVATSDRDGKLVFPRTTQQEEFTLVITHDVQVVYDLSNVIKELRVPKKEDYTVYTIKRIFDEETGASLWEVTPNKEVFRTIPLHSIIILAKPENVYVPTGVTMADNLPNLHLPTIFIKPSIDHLDNALFILNIKQYFAPIRRLYQKGPSGYEALAVTHEAVEAGA